MGRLRLMGETLSGIADRHGWKNRLRHDHSSEDPDRTGAIPQDSEDLVDYTVSMRGVEVGMLFIEQARGGVKVSFASRNGWTVLALAPNSAAADTAKPPGRPMQGADARNASNECCTAVRKTLASGG